MALSGLFAQASVEDEVAAPPLEKRNTRSSSGCSIFPRCRDRLSRGRVWDQIRDSLLRDAETLAEGGVHGLMMENFGDVPFYPDRVPAHVIAQMTMLLMQGPRSHRSAAGDQSSPAQRW